MLSKGYYKLVRRVLEENIRQGKIPRGTRLYIAAVADRLALSPPPVRRALEQLMKEGFLTKHHHNGYVVGESVGDAAQQSRENLHLLDLDLSLFETGRTTPLAPRWETILEEVERGVLHVIPFGTFRLSEAELCEHFGVSRTVSREVLARLDVQGHVEKNRSSHWIVGPLSARRLDEAHEMRRLLEPQALSDVAPRLDRNTLVAMRRNIDEFRLGGVKPTAEEMAALEYALHRKLLDDCRNRSMLANVVKQQIAHVVDDLFQAHVGVTDEAALLEEHDLVLGHLLARDGDGAVNALRHHLDLHHQRTRARLKVLSIFDPPGDLPYLTRVH